MDTMIKPKRIRNIKKATINIEVPVEMLMLFQNMNEQEILRRDALMLYPCILDGSMSHGQVADILGITRLDLIDLYAEMGFFYFDLTMDELDRDISEFYEAMGTKG